MEEALHLRRRTQSSSEIDESITGFPSTFSASTSSSASEGDEGAVSTEEKNVELDVANSSKAAKEIGVVNGDGGGELESARKHLNSKGSVSNCCSGSGCGGSDSEVKGKEGLRFKDLGGMTKVLEELNDEVIEPLRYPQLLRYLGGKPITGILLHGPPGCGKTKLAHALANETGIPFYHISATEVVSGVSGASEENIRELFSKAYRTAPSIVFIDEIDAIASKRENLQRQMEQRIVTQLITCMCQTNSSGRYVLVIGATNRPDSLDPALRRPGRFDLEIVVGIPDESAREEILFVLIRNLKLEDSFDVRKIARSTPGYGGADLEALVNKAANLALKRIIRERKRELSEHSEDSDGKLPLPEKMLDELVVKMSDFEEAIKMVQPSLRREGFSTIPNVKWEDIGGLDHIRHEFYRYIGRRLKYPEEYERFGVNLGTGFLLDGPPGCGKTLIAKAVANEAGANFIHIKGPEILNKYVGESELAIRTLFSRARACSPCIIFFDEVDALTAERGKEGGWVVERLLNQFLIELDGAEERRDVFVIGATNRPGVMDLAVLRPGRFGKHLLVPLPNAEERVSIMKALTRKMPVDASVDLSDTAKACENLSGADLAALMNEAAMFALDEKLTPTETTSDTRTIKTSHIKKALSKLSQSMTDMVGCKGSLLSNS